MIKTIAWLTQLGRKLTFNLLPESLISFLVVGALGVLVHLTVLKLSMSTIIHAFTYANLMAMVFAATFNYVLNNNSTFADSALVGRHVYLGYVCYVGITAVGMAISLSISTRIYATHGMPMIAALCGIVAGSLWNYLVSYTLVWKFLFSLSKQQG
ncbi:MAG TPA: GtrA family protein [Dyella sp.]|uniref:GtrA family protein n=1 Tax=Dyella sp. TaxID=1869338 RepID=UPI002BB051B1|nr:GtrA family protein [Dyella sp.]HTV84721.1 GtrA family protein [Dyella sp.]